MKELTPYHIREILKNDVIFHQGGHGVVQVEQIQGLGGYKVSLTCRTEVGIIISTETIEWAQDGVMDYIIKDLAARFWEAQKKLVEEGYERCTRRDY